MAIYTGNVDLLTNAPTTRRKSIVFFFYRGQSLSFASVADVCGSRMHAFFGTRSHGRLLAPG